MFKKESLRKKECILDLPEILPVCKILVNDELAELT